MGKNLIPILGAAAGLTAIAMTGGAATPAVAAAEGGTAAGAGAGAGLLSGGSAFGSADMMAAGAAGGLGSSAAAAPSFGAGILSPTASGVAPEDANLASMGLTPNSYTGGYDSLNGLQRMGQRVTGAFDNMGSMNKMPNISMPQQQQRPVNPASGGAPRPVMSQPTQPVQLPYGYNPQNNQQNYNDPAFIEWKRQQGIS